MPRYRIVLHFALPTKRATLANEGVERIVLTTRTTNSTLRDDVSKSRPTVSNATDVYTQGIYKVYTRCIQGIYRVYTEYIQSIYRVHIEYI